MRRNDLIRALRVYARKRNIAFWVDEKKGKGSHYRVKVGNELTTIQSDLNPSRIQRILKQLRIDPAEL